MSFASDVERIAKNMGDTAENVARATFIELFNAVIKDTPVDTGRLRGNWQTTEDSPASGVIDRKQLDAFGDVNAEVFNTIKKPGTYYLTNNLPYAAVAEFGQWPLIGFSPKAPKGMVRLNAKRIKSILRRKASGFN